jgi:UDP-3-O-[3-hydroxymyristoyl] N-acetylglucosamine deacetylase
LHGGREAAVELRRCEGASRFGDDLVQLPLAALDLQGRARQTTARLDEAREISTVEHVLAAIVGCAAFDGLEVRVLGGEAPLLDGGAREVTAAIASLGVARSARVVVVQRPFEWTDGDARYRFAPSDRQTIEVDVAFPAARFGRALAGRARFDGDPAAFAASIATARTFGAARELASLRARGLGAHVPEGSVVAIDHDPSMAAGYAPRDPQEPVRHKLLDLLGDLAGLGGALIGSLVAERPSHLASARALFAARAAGVISAQLSSRPGRLHS